VVARLSADAAAGAATLSLESAVAGREIPALLNADDKSLIWIGDSQHAAIRAVSGGTVSIDTDPGAAGDQGLLRAYLAGTPVTRVDVATFQIRSDPGDRKPYLSIDRHRGAEHRVADGVSDLQVVTVAAHRHYRVALTAMSDVADPLSGAPLTHTISADVAVRN
jgi:hypothetical protein